MIRLKKESQPQVLVDNRTAWTTEYVNWCLNLVGTAPRRYAHRDVRQALEEETSSKCAYCEARIKVVAYSHIEHMLPKRKHPHLVCDWENLTIACPKCNIEKGEYDDPGCPLLDPYKDDVEAEVVFLGTFALPRGGARASATITQLDLNRMELQYERGEAIWSMFRLLDTVERLASEPAVVQALWLEIDKFTDSRREFSSACRQFLEFEMQKRGITRF